MTPLLAAFRPGDTGLEPTDPGDVEPGSFERPLWVDVDPKADPAALASELDRLGGRADPELVERLLADTRPFSTGEPTSAESPSRQLWAFGATTAMDAEPMPYVDLQPVTILLAGGVVATCRHDGARYGIGPSARRATGTPIELDRLRREATTIWQAKESGDAGDRDLLLFALLNGLVATQFVTRAELAQKKTEIDWKFFDELAKVRRRAAAWQPSVNEVAEVAVRASALIDETRARLVAIQELVLEFRRWYDELKPPGRLNKATIWLPQTTRRTESERLVDEIYRVRNDLRDVRREVHASMALLASADTGGQLLAVRALLDRTEAARRAVIVAATLTVLLASAALAAGLAAVPSSGTRFAVVRAGAAAATVAVLAVFAGVGVALAAGRSSGMHSHRLAHVVEAVLALASTACFVAALSVDAVEPVAFLVAGTVFALAAIGLFAYVGDFGGGRIPHPETAALERFMRNRREWSGSADELARRLRGRWPLRRHTPAAGSELCERLREQAALLGSLGIDVAYERGVTVTRSTAEERG